MIFSLKSTIVFSLSLMAMLISCSKPSASPQMHLKLQNIQLPDGFKIEIYAADVPNARSMSLSPNGTLFVGNRSQDKVWALVDRDQDFHVDEKHVIAQELTMPNGVAFKDGSLYVAEYNRVIRFDDIENNLKHPPKPVVVNDSFPQEASHAWKFIRFGPDGKLYVPFGAPCNICNPAKPIYASIHRMNLDGSNLELFASGVRNTVGFDWDPLTDELWFTDNGRDMLGDDIPPDELNHAPQQGMHFGYPFCHGQGISDPEFGHLRKCEQTTPAAQALGAHVASLGMRFYTGKMFPKKYHNQIFIAEHGSWNRSQKSGYQISLVTLDDNRKPVAYEPFATGWLINENAWGRPVDLEIMPDGSLLVSDDQAGMIYRISYVH